MYIILNKPVTALIWACISCFFNSFFNAVEEVQQYSVVVKWSLNILHIVSYLWQKRLLCHLLAYSVAQKLDYFWKKYRWISPENEPIFSKDSQYWLEKDATNDATTFIYFLTFNSDLYAWVVKLWKIKFEEIEYVSSNVKIYYIRNKGQLRYLFPHPPSPNVEICYDTFL